MGLSQLERSVRGTQHDIVATKSKDKARESETEKRRPAFEAEYSRISVSVWRQNDIIKDATAAAVMHLSERLVLHPKDKDRITSFFARVIH